MARLSASWAARKRVNSTCGGNFATKLRKAGVDLVMVRGRSHKPVYITMPGWRKDISGARRFADLPAAAQRYVKKISSLIDLPVNYVSVGPGRQATLRVR